MDRNELVNKAEKLINENKIEEDNKIIDQIKEIDKNVANEKAMKKGNIINKDFLNYIN